MADVSTSGWDVVSVTDIETLNKVINEGDNHPKSFSDYITVVGNDLKVEGEWGDWSIANEASGKNIYMQCSIKNATVTYIGKSYPINDDKNA
ncbi:TULIP family P47-like protein [Proteus vulgaris]|nr:TULIP family P47-like protein [Proteus vulgaris]